MGAVSLMGCMDAATDDTAPTGQEAQPLIGIANYEYRLHHGPLPLLAHGARYDGHLHSDLAGHLASLLRYAAGWDPWTDDEPPGSG